jgi:hypothetical protein
MFQRDEVAITNIMAAMVSMRMEIVDYSFPTLEFRYLCLLITERMKTSHYGLKHTAFVNSNTGAKFTYISPLKRLSLPYFSFCFVICVMWSDIPSEETCLRY